VKEYLKKTLFNLNKENIIWLRNEQLPRKQLADQKSKKLVENAAKHDDLQKKHPLASKRILTSFC